MTKSVRKSKKRMNILFFFLSLFTLGTVQAQTMFGGAPVADTPVEFANNDYEAGLLEVSITLPSGKTAADVEITLPQGIEYLAGSMAKKSGTLSITHEASSPLNKPVFKLTGTGTIIFSIKRKVTKAALSKLKVQGGGFSDVVKITAGGTTESKNSNAYSLPIPNIVVQLAEPTHNNASGTSIKKFVLRNTGEGATKEIFFSVKYPTGITGNEISYNGTPLTPEATLPSGEKIYKVTAPTAAGFIKNADVEITEKYTVTSCGSKSIVYTGYWGENATTLYEGRDLTRAVNVENGTPNIVLDEDSNHTYFEWGDGICGNTLGTFTVQYINKGSGNATAYDLQMLITPYVSWRGFKTHKPANFRIVAADGSEVSINSMTPNGSEVIERQISFKDLPDLNHTTLGTKNIGLEDVDGDGFRDDLPINAKLKVRFDMVPNQPIVCLQNDGGIFSVSPHSKFSYNDACGTLRTSAVQAITNNTFRRLISGVADTSKIPASLSQNELTFGYISLGSHTIINQQRLEGSATAGNPTKWKYEIKLPAGVELKNVKFYEGIGYGQSTKAPENLAPIAPGGTLTYESSTRGYITFDMLLTNPCNSGNVSLQYNIYYLDKVGNTNTYCELPFICANTSIGTICPGTCAGNGPVMISTKAERADNSYGWTDYTMNTRQTRANVSAIDRSRTLYLDDIEIISKGEQSGCLLIICSIMHR